MNTRHSTSLQVQVISGLAICFWLCFTSLWICLYIQAQQRSSPISHVDKSFHVTALLYQGAAVAFFTAEFTYECTASLAVQQAVQICFLYLPLAYVMGMACSLGFGTLSARISSKHMVVLAGMWGTVFTALTLQELVSKVPQVLISAVFLCAFALQVATTLVTLGKSSKDAGNAAKEDLWLWLSIYTDHKVNFVSFSRCFSSYLL